MCIIVILAGIRIVWVVWIVNAPLPAPLLSIDIIMPEMGKGCQALSSRSHNSSFISDQRYPASLISLAQPQSLSYLHFHLHLICLLRPVSVTWAGFCLGFSVRDNMLYCDEQEEKCRVLNQSADDWDDSSRHCSAPGLDSWPRISSRQSSG